ncbi:MAG: PTS-dependent dihydroxyacetone kinase phosphotransferase subunit DhaM, partial [Anaerolineae bacterium]
VAALQDAESEVGVLALLDLGCAVMSTQVAIEMLPEEKRDKVTISEAPLVEGAIVASVEASLGRSLEEVNNAAVEARNMEKLT